MRANASSVTPLGSQCLVMPSVAISVSHVHLAHTSRPQMGCMIPRRMAWPSLGPLRHSVRHLPDPNIDLQRTILCRIRSLQRMAILRELGTSKLLRPHGLRCLVSRAWSTKAMVATGSRRTSRAPHGLTSRACRFCRSEALEAALEAVEWPDMRTSQVLPPLLSLSQATQPRRAQPCLVKVHQIKSGHRR